MLHGIMPSLFPICPPSQQAYLSDIILTALQDRLRAEADESLREEIEAEARGEIDLPRERTAISAELWQAHILE